MKHKIIYLITLSLLMFSCEYDYDIGLGEEFTPKVVVNSIITPDSTIKVSLFWSQKLNYNDYNNKYDYIKQFKAKIYEDDKMIVGGDFENGKIVTEIKPKEGSKYRLEIDVPEYGALKAETYIPSAPTINVTHVERPPSTNQFVNRYIHFSVNDIKPNGVTRSVIIKSFGLYKYNKTEVAYSFYATNPFCDQFNAVADNYDVVDRGSNVAYDYFIRIPYKNIQYATPLAFSVHKFNPNSRKIVIGHDQWGYPIYEYENDPPITMVSVIAPSDDYDRYYNDAYKQQMFSDLSNQSQSIYSNIENGVGIFAGYSSTNFKKEPEHVE